MEMTIAPISGQIFIKAVIPLKTIIYSLFINFNQWISQGMNKTILVSVSQGESN
jgi:hypothetical protein